MTYKPHEHARAGDPSTSKAAAQQLDPASQLDTYRRVFEAAGEDGLTAEQAAWRTPYGTDGGNYTKRVSDLIRQGVIAPTANLDDPDESFDIDLVAREARETPARIVMNNTFGFGGHNTTLMLKTFEG